MKENGAQTKNVDWESCSGERLMNCIQVRFLMQFSIRNLKIQAGQWENDEPHGIGEHIWGEGTMKGSMKKQLCNMYRGSFVAGKREGFGTFFYMNGSQYTGYWKNNMKDGTGVHIFSDGKIFAGW